MVETVGEHPIAVRFRGAMEGLARGETVGLLALLSDEIEWWTVGAEEPIRGRDGVETLLAERTGSNVVYEIHDLFANDEHLVALIHARVRHDGSDVRFSFAEVCHFDAAGLMTKRQAFAQNTDMVVTSYT